MYRYVHIGLALDTLIEFFTLMIRDNVVSTILPYYYKIHPNYFLRYDYEPTLKIFMNLEFNLDPRIYRKFPNS